MRLRADFAYQNDGNFNSNIARTSNSLQSFNLPILPTTPIKINRTDKGRLAYRTDTNQVIFCDGTQWLALSASTGVVRVDTGTGLLGGPITNTGTIFIANTAVTPASYTYSNITVNAQGQITSASSGVSPVTSILAGTGISVTGSVPTFTVSLSNTAVSSGVYTFPSSVTVNAQGQITAISSGSAPTGGTVTEINTGTGLSGGPITTTGTILLANTAVTPGSYTYSSFTVDAQGRLTAASSGVNPVVSVSAGTGISITGTASAPIINLANTAVTPGSYTYSSFTVDQQGRLTAASSGVNPVTSVSAGTGISITGTSSAPIVNIANTGVTPDNYTYPSSLTVNQQGQITSIASGPGSLVGSVTAGTGITVTGTATDPIINITDTAVTPGSYTYSSFTVNAQGQLTAASSGTDPVTSVGVGTGLNSTGGTTPILSLANTTVVAGTYYYPSILEVNSQGQFTSVSSGSPFSWLFGSGTDGDVTIAGTTTLTADMFYDDLEVNGTLNTAGFRVFVKNSLTGSGTIQNNGNNASGATAGTAAATGTIGGGTAGGNGGAVSTVGTVGGSVTATTRIGGVGGAGGSATAGGGAGGTGTQPAAAQGGIDGSGRFKPWQVACAAVNGRDVANTLLRGGAGGGGGSGSASATGGGGGGGTGVLMIYVGGTVNFSGTLSARGGNGAQGGTNAGGGGGGGGGYIFMCAVNSNIIQFASSTNVSGGTPGASNGTGNAGVLGGSGVVQQLYLN